MDKNKTGKTGKNNLNAGKGSASFGSTFSINRFLESLGGAKHEETTTNFNNEIIENGQLENTNQEPQINQINENDLQEIVKEQELPQETANDLEQNNEIEPRMQFAINKFSGKTWVRKNKSKELVNVSAVNENNVEQESQAGQNTNLLFSKNEEDLLNDNYLEDANITENNANSVLGESIEETPISAEPEQNTNENNNYSTATDFDDFEAFLNSLSNNAEPLSATSNSTNSTLIDSESTESDAVNADNLTEMRAENVAKENAHEETINESEKQAQQENASEESQAGTPAKQRRSISKLDYFKYRFLANSAVGADGKAKVEELATRYGNTRKDNAGVISSDQSEDVQVHYSGDFKDNEINLDFSKKGNAKVYKNSKLLSIFCSVFAVVYAIVGLTLFLVIGKVHTEPVVAQSIEMNYGGIIYQEVGTKLDLAGLKVITNYSNENFTTVDLTYSMITNLSSVVDSNYNITIETSNEPINLEVNLNGFTTNFKLWAYKWAVDDVTVYYYKTSTEISTNNFNNVLCYAVFSKNLGGKNITFKKNIVLSGTNCEFTNTSITRVYVAEINAWKVATLVSM